MSTTQAKRSRSRSGIGAVDDVTTAADPYTVSLLHMDGVDASTTFTDEYGKVWTANGNAQIDTAQSKFGGASGLFDGTGDWIDTPDHDDFNVGSGNFTVDCWIKKNEDGRIQYFAGKSAASPIAANYSFYFRISASNILISNWSDGSSEITATSTGTITIASGWTHLAFVRNGNTLTQYINGTADGTCDLTGVTINNDAYKFAIGRLGEYTDAARLFNGWVDEFRFSKGVARWTTNFTPPTAPY